MKAAQGKLSEACANYEKALNYFRKQKNKNADYPRALESYADVLNKAKQTAKANSIYEEARAYYRRKDSERSDQQTIRKQPVLPPNPMTM